MKSRLVPGRDQIAEVHPFDFVYSRTKITTQFLLINANLNQEQQPFQVLDHVSGGGRGMYSLFGVGSCCEEMERIGSGKTYMEDPSLFSGWIVSFSVSFTQGNGIAIRGS